MAITIEDIARDAGVSIATVSRVMNGTKSVSLELQDRVLKVIKQNNFRPNTLARGLITNQTFTIGVIISDIGNPVFGALTKGINRVCQDRNYTVIICESDGKQEKELALLQKLSEQRIDGLLFAGVNVSESLAQTMLEMDYPTVLVTQEEYGGMKHLPTVVHYNAQAIQDAVDFLASSGHSRIAFIGGPENDFSSGIKRLEGYRSALKDIGIKPLDSYVEHGSFTFESGFECMKRIYEENRDLPTAVMVCSDLMAIGAMQFARSMGVSVPEELSVMGFDDSDLAMYSTPALSTVRVSYQDEGVAAAEELFRRIDGGDRRPTIRHIPHKVIRRSSVCRIGEAVKAPQ
jgi:LacI family transcriptional regulator